MKTRTITRTIATNICSVLVFMRANKQVYNTDFIAVGNYTEKELEKLAKAHYEALGDQFVAITEIEKHEHLYSVSESDFVNIAEMIK